MKKLTSIFIVTLFTLMFSCQSVEEFPKPEVILSEDLMVNMLVDMTLLNATKSISRKELEDSGINPKEFMCSKYDIEPVVFKENTKYYSNDLDNYEKIFQRVADTIQKRKEKIDTIIKIRDAKTTLEDSLKLEKPLKLGDSLKLKDLLKLEDSLKLENLAEPITLKDSIAEYTK